MTSLFCCGTLNLNFPRSLRLLSTPAPSINSRLKTRPIPQSAHFPNPNSLPFRTPPPLMKGDTPHLRSRHQTRNLNHVNGFCEPNGAVKGTKYGNGHDHDKMISKKNYKKCGGLLEKAYFMRWKPEDAVDLVRHHPLPCVFAACVLFFMGVEYTLRMIPSSSPPFDLGFVVTLPLNRLLASRPSLNNFLAGLNTVFVGMQTAYILGTWLVEGRARATISALFMFTCRGILGYVTQLPVPEDFLGSGVDFPVGNVSFFLFYSGHVAASVIASLDMKRMQRWEMGWAFDLLNILQVVRLLSTRGHYTIDLVVGVGAGILFDSLAGKYLECKQLKDHVDHVPKISSTNGSGGGYTSALYGM